ncbi:hypothetical protein [Dyadobacter sp. 3J3]|uniref:hypothetical protein n=1 Tax=Dyadobacter sp. 3J3 TaxID=2606600 RepID=UPI00135B618E|nr:hypothetical protein [Dyadobacter sp. 3J3]
MFYDFNRHKRLAAPVEKPSENPALGAILKKHLARIPEKVKMPVLILLISLTGLGFLRLTMEGITGAGFSQFTSANNTKFYRPSLQAIEVYLDSLESAYIQDSLSQFSLKP